MPQKQHVMHGRDHRPGGPDPIPGIFLGEGGANYIWAGGHGPIDSSAGAQTAVECPFAYGAGEIAPAPTDNKFYTGAEVPDLTETHTGNIGLGFWARDESTP